MPANRRKTIEYAFSTRITPLATAATLASAARHNTPAVTLYIPETASRGFLSVRLIATYRTEFAAANSVTGWRFGVQLGGAATSDTDRASVANNARSNVSDVVDLDVTSYFNANFGGGASQTCVASLAVSTSAVAAVNGITCKLVITYEFDASAQPVRIKTVRIPIQSQTDTLPAVAQEIGTDGVTAAPANQIPALDAFLPESGKVIRQIFLESTANDCNPTNPPGTTAFTPFLQIDGAAEVARATIDEKIPTPLVWRDILDLTGAITTSAPHALWLRCSVAGRLGFANSTLIVTYEYSTAATTAILCEAMVPLTISSDDSPGIAIGESVSSDPQDAQALIAALSVQEANPRLVQSAVYLNCVVFGRSAVVYVRAGGQSYRPYDVIDAVGDAPVVHRVDHAGGWALNRGDNRLVLDVYNGPPPIGPISALVAPPDLSGYALINYVAAAPNDVDTATHVVNYFATSFGSSAPNAVDVPASGGGQRVPVLGRPYRIQAVMVEQYGHVALSALLPQLLVEQRAGEWDGAGFIATPFRHGLGTVLTQVGTWRITWPLTGAFNLDHLHTGKLDVEAARRQVAWDAQGGWQASWSWWITYHQLTFSVTGAVTVGGAPVADGKPVEIYATDASGRVERVAQATTGSGTGAFAAEVVDDTRSYFASYEDGPTLGRSTPGTPGSSTFAIAIAEPGAAASTPATARDVRAQIVEGGEVEVSWSYPGDIASQGIAFDVYVSHDPTDPFRSAAATAIAALGVRLPAAPLAGDRYVTVVGRRGRTLGLPARPAFVSIPQLGPASAGAGGAPAGAQLATGLGFPFGISPSGGVVAQGGDDLLRGKILQLLLTSPGERVNRPDYGTRLLDLVFDPSSEVLAATTEFAITRALQQAFDDEIQLDAVQVTSDDTTLLIDISYLRRSDLTLDQLRIGVPLPAGAAQ